MNRLSKFVGALCYWTRFDYVMWAVAVVGAVIWIGLGVLRDNDQQQEKQTLESLCAAMCESHRVVSCVVLKDPTFPRGKCAAVCMLDGSGNEFRLVVHPDGGAP